MLATQGKEQDLGMSRDVALVEMHRLLNDSQGLDEEVVLEESLPPAASAGHISDAEHCGSGSTVTASPLFDSKCIARFKIKGCLFCRCSGEASRLSAIRKAFLAAKLHT